MSEFSRVESKRIYKGQIINVSVDTFRYQDGSEVVREVVAHPGAVAIVAYDNDFIYLVQQPREATGESALLEIPAGKLDSHKDGETPDPLRAAKRELAEEIGKAAETWEYLCGCYVSPGFTDEFVHIYFATGLSESHAEAEEYERITIVKVPLTDLDQTIKTLRDGKTIIGLLELRRRLTS